MINLRKCFIFTLLLFPMLSMGQSSTSTPNVGLKIPSYGSLDDQIIFGYDLNQLDLFLSGNSATTPTTWKSSTTYANGQFVLFLGKAYVSSIANNTGNVPSTSPSDWTTTFVSGVGLGYTPLNSADNLSDLGSASAARSNLGLASAALLNQTSNQAFQGPISTPGVNSVLNPSTYSGSDLGQQIITAGTACSNLCTLDVPSGTYAVNTNATTPAGVRLKFEQGAVVTVASGVTWTLNSVLDAGRFHIFSGAGTVSFATNTSLREIYPEWWGAVPDGGTGATDSAPGWQAAVNAASDVDGYGGTVSCPSAVYSVYNTVTSFAPTTGSGVSLLGPGGNLSGTTTGCVLDWYGVPGGTVYHKIGGHFDQVQGVTFVGGGRGLWLDSSNGAAAAVSPTTSNITSVVRSCVATLGTAATPNCIDTVTTSASLTGWVSGMPVRFSGVSDPSLNGNTFPIWYAISSTQFVISQYGVSGTLATSGTVTVQSGGDISGDRVSHNAVYSVAPPAISITSCSIASNILSCTLAAPQIMYPEQWVWITASSDPVYNAYWQIKTVTSATTFTATATEVASEAATSTGTLYGPSVGISMGADALALATNSVCCTSFDHNLMVAPESGSTTVAAFEEDSSGTGNTYDYSFEHDEVLGYRVGWLDFTKGSFTTKDEVGSSVADAIYASSWGGATVDIEGGEWENGTPYFIANLLSGSYNAAVQGVNGQFELVSGSGGSMKVVGNSIEFTGYGGSQSPDGVVISAGTNLDLEGNSFGEPTIATGSVTGIAYTSGSGQTPGTYIVSASGGGGTGAQISVTVGTDGNVDITGTNPYPVVVLNQGHNYTSIPTFTLAAGGTPATFTASLGQVSLININPSFANASNSIPKTSFFSKNNVFANVTAGGWVPVLYGGATAFGNGSGLTAPSVTSIGDKTLLHSPTTGTLPWGVGTFQLAQGQSLTALRYLAPPVTNTTQPNDAATGFVQCPNNIPCMASRNAANTGDDTLGWNTSDQLVLQNPTGTWSVPVEDASGDLVVPGNLFGGLGGFGSYQNYAIDSEFQVPSWSIYGQAPTLTKNAATNAWGASTLEQAVTNPTSYTEQYQSTTALIIGQPNTISVYAKVASGTAAFSLLMTSGGDASECHSGSFTATTTLQRFQYTCTPSSNATGNELIAWYTTSVATFYFGDIQLEPGASVAGASIVTTSAAVPLTTGLVVKGAAVASGTATSVANDVVTYGGTQGQTQDSGVPISSLATQAYVLANAANVPGFLSGLVEQWMVGPSTYLWGTQGNFALTCPSSTSLYASAGATSPLLLTQTSAAVAGDCAGWFGGSSPYYANRQPLVKFGVALPASADYGSTNSARIWLGLYGGSGCTQATVFASDAPASPCSLAAIRYSNTAGDTAYQCVTSNAGTETVTPITGAVPSTTFTPMSISIGASSVTCSVGSYSATNSTNLPASITMTDIFTNTAETTTAVHLYMNGVLGKSQNGTF